ncbi:hypothetical protein BGW38_010870, partial [Lunasporangiospora selenospora]
MASFNVTAVDVVDLDAMNITDTFPEASSFDLDMSSSYNHSYTDSFSGIPAAQQALWDDGQLTMNTSRIQYAIATSPMSSFNNSANTSFNQGFLPSPSASSSNPSGRHLQVPSASPHQHHLHHQHHLQRTLYHQQGHALHPLAQQLDYDIESNYSRHTGEGARSGGEDDSFQPAWETAKDRENGAGSGLPSGIMTPNNFDLDHRDESPLLLYQDSVEANLSRGEGNSLSLFARLGNESELSYDLFKEELDAEETRDRSRLLGLDPSDPLLLSSSPFPGMSQDNSPLRVSTVPNMPTAFGPPPPGSQISQQQQPFRNEIFDKEFMASLRTPLVPQPPPPLESALKKQHFFDDLHKIPEPVYNYENTIDIVRHKSHDDGPAAHPSQLLKDTETGGSSKTENEAYKQALKSFFDSLKVADPIKTPHKFAPQPLPILWNEPKLRSKKLPNLDLDDYNKKSSTSSPTTSAFSPALSTLSAASAATQAAMTTLSKVRSAKAMAESNSSGIENGSKTGLGSSKGSMAHAALSSTLDTPAPAPASAPGPPLTLAPEPLPTSQSSKHASTSSSPPQNRVVPGFGLAGLEKESNQGPPDPMMTPNAEISGSANHHNRHQPPVLPASALSSSSLASLASSTGSVARRGSIRRPESGVTLPSETQNAPFSTPLGSGTTYTTTASGTIKLRPSPLALRSTNVDVDNGFAVGDMGESGHERPFSGAEDENEYLSRQLRPPAAINPSRLPGAGGPALRKRGPLNQDMFQQQDSAGTTTETGSDLQEGPYQPQDKDLTKPSSTTTMPASAQQVQQLQQQESMTGSATISRRGSARLSANILPESLTALNNHAMFEEQAHRRNSEQLQLQVQPQQQTKFSDGGLPTPTSATTVAVLPTTTTAAVSSSVTSPPTAVMTDTAALATPTTATTTTAATLSLPTPSSAASIDHKIPSVGGVGTTQSLGRNFAARYGRSGSGSSASSAGGGDTGSHMNDPMGTNSPTTPTTATTGLGIGGVNPYGTLTGSRAARQGLMSGHSQNRSSLGAGATSPSLQRMYSEEGPTSGTGGSPYSKLPPTPTSTSPPRSTNSNGGGYESRFGSTGIAAGSKLQSPLTSTTSRTTTGLRTSPPGSTPSSNLGTPSRRSSQQLRYSQGSLEDYVVDGLGASAGSPEYAPHPPAPSRQLQPRPSQLRERHGGQYRQQESLGAAAAMAYGVQDRYGAEDAQEDDYATYDDYYETASYQSPTSGHDTYSSRPSSMRLATAGHYRRSSRELGGMLPRLTMPTAGTHVNGGYEYGNVDLETSPTTPTAAPHSMRRPPLPMSMTSPSAGLSLNSRRVSTASSTGAGTNSLLPSMMGLPTSGRPGSSSGTGLGIATGPSPGTGVGLGVSGLYQPSVQRSTSLYTTSGATLGRAAASRVTASLMDDQQQQQQLSGVPPRRVTSMYSSATSSGSGIGSGSGSISGGSMRRGSGIQYSSAGASSRRGVSDSIYGGGHRPYNNGGEMDDGYGGDEGDEGEDYVRVFNPSRPAVSRPTTDYMSSSSINYRSGSISSIASGTSTVTGIPSAHGGGGGSAYYSPIAPTRKSSLNAYAPGPGYVRSGSGSSVGSNVTGGPKSMRSQGKLGQRPYSQDMGMAMPGPSRGMSMSGGSSGAAGGGQYSS